MARKRKNPSTTMWALLLGGGGLAYYFLVHKKRQPLIKGAVPSVAKGAAASGARDTAFMQAWDSAKTERNEYFTVRDKAGNVNCFKTSSGMPVSLSHCQKAGLAGMGNDHTLSSQGYGSLGGTAAANTLSSKGYGSLS